jgi:hypothetical protein
MRRGLVAAVSRRRRDLLLLGVEPSGEQSSLTFAEAVVAANGSTQLPYTATVKDESGTAMAGLSGLSVSGVSFPTLAAIAAELYVSIDSPFIDSDGVDERTVTFTVGITVDGDFVPLRNATLPAGSLVLTVSGTNNTIVQPSQTLNASGVTTGTFKTTQAATVKTVGGTFLGTTLTNTVTCESDGVGGGSGLFWDVDFESGSLAGEASGGASFGGSTQASVTSVSPISGTYSLLFEFVGHPTDDDRAEQRFNLGRNITEVWVEYDLHVPSNYEHRDGPSSDNNKFFRIWGDDYVSANKVGSSTHRTGTGGGSQICHEYNYKTWADGTLGRGPVGPTTRAEGVDFAYNSQSAMVGATTQIREHYKMVSATDADDGEYHLWYNGTLMRTFTGIPQKYDTAKPYWNTGYFLGAANSGFDENTEFRIDNIKFYDTDPGW